MRVLVFPTILSKENSPNFSLPILFMAIWQWSNVFYGQSTIIYMESVFPDNRWSEKITKLQNMLKAIQTIPKHTKKEKVLCSFKSLFSLNFWHYTFYWFRLVIQFVFTHNKIDQQFKQQQLQICNIHFWKELLKED